MAADDWPKAVGEHRVSERWECLDCGASYDCLSQFRDADCERGRH